MKTKLQKYDKYKPSGLDWLGDIPEGWEVRRIKDCGNSVLGKMLDNETGEGKYLKPYLKSKNIQWQNISLDQVEEMYFTKNDLRQYKIKQNDLLLSEGGEVGKTSIWNCELTECYIQNSVHKITINSSNYFKYYYYQSFVLGSNEYYNSIVNVISIRHLTKEKLINIKLLQPPIQTQIQIANYLDTQTANIDREIELLTAKASKYQQLKQTLISETVTKGLDKSAKLNPSGVEWIGDIPEGWEVRRLKDIGFLTGAGVDKKISELDKYVKLINYTDIYKSTTKEITNQDNYMVVTANNIQIKEKNLKYGDVLFTPSSETVEDIGVSAVIFEDLIDTLYSYHLVRVRFGSQLVTSYKKYLFNNQKIQNYFSKSSKGTTRKILGMSEFNNLLLPIPSIFIQQQIANYLDEQTGKIDQIISTINTKITKLKEYRKVMINDVVTGRVKIEN